LPDPAGISTEGVHAVRDDIDTRVRVFLADIDPVNNT